MQFEELAGNEVLPAGMTCPRHKAHAGGHFAVGDFALDSATWVERLPLPFFNATWRGVRMTAERALVGLGLVIKAINVVGHKLLCEFHVDFALSLIHI